VHLRQRQEVQEMLRHDGLVFKDSQGGDSLLPPLPQPGVAGVAGMPSSSVRFPAYE
jgi:hypothetical protein